MLDLDSIREYTKWPDDILSDTARHHLRALIAEVERLRGQIGHYEIITKDGKELLDSALAEIEQLRAKLAAAERERDAAQAEVADLKLRLANAEEARSDLVLNAKQQYDRWLAAQADNKRAYEYLANLFNVLAPECSPFDDLVGLCTQVDNWCAGAMQDKKAHTAMWDKAERERDEALGEVKAWTETASQHLRNEEYYRGLVIRIGERFGVEAKTADDGTVMDDVLCAKVPELVQQAQAETRAFKKLLAELWNHVKWSDIPLSLAIHIHAALAAPSGSKRVEANVFDGILKGIGVVGLPQKQLEVMERVCAIAYQINRSVDSAELWDALSDALGNLGEMVDLNALAALEKEE